MSTKVDLTTINGVESLSHDGEKDPWARKLAGDFADMFVYSDIIDIILPLSAVTSPYDPVKLPALLQDLQRRDSDCVCPVIYPIGNGITLKDEYLDETFRKFKDWAMVNYKTLRRWSTLHNEPWIRTGHSSRIANKYVFSFDKLSSDFSLLAQRLTLSEADIAYAFDVVLRFPLYGSLVGQNNYYLNHPIRDIISLPTQSDDGGKPPVVAISFKDSISKLAPRLTIDELSSLLHNLRGVVREKGLHKVAAGQVDKEIIRDIAADPRINLPPRLKLSDDVEQVGGGIVGAVLAPVYGIGVSIASSVWNGELPRSVGRIKWLRWALKWDIEAQAERRD